MPRNQTPKRIDPQLDPYSGFQDDIERGKALKHRESCSVVKSAFRWVAVVLVTILAPAATSPGLLKILTLGKL